MTTQSHHSKNRTLEVFDGDRELSKFLETNFTESLKNMIKLTVKTMVKTEMEAFRKEYGEKLYFNGSYGRNMTSSFGRIEDIPIPRFRQSPDGMDMKSLGVFDEEQQKFMKLVEQMHLLGISQRKIKLLTKTCLGIPVSVDKIGAIWKELADQEDANINQKPLDDTYEYLLLDGIWEKTKGYGWDQNKSVLLCALGVRPDGARRIIGFSLARTEDADTWGAFVRSLKMRGLTGRALKLLLVDDHAGLRRAIGSVYPTIPVQTCIAHKMRNVLGKTSYKQRQMVTADVTDIFRSETKDEAMEKAKSVVKKWYMTELKAMESLRTGIETCFTYFSFPKTQWTSVRTTNLLEREFREFRRRLKVFDNTFQSELSANRYANRLFTYLNSSYPLKGGLHTNP